MPKYKLNVFSEALLDIREAADWYDRQLPGLGARFTTEVRKQIDKLKTNAYLHQIYYDEVRCLVIKKFPFMVHFDIEDENQIVNIYAVFHTSRNPQIWRSRK